MKKPLVSIIAAHDTLRGIGINNDLPWHISKDLKHFKELTIGKPVIMGRNTYESIFSRIHMPLPGRENIVITSRELETHINLTTATSLDEGLKYAETLDSDEIFIIGGAQLYASSLPLADKLYITRIDGTYNCDTFFPNYEDDFSVSNKIDEAENGITFSWLELTRN